jgi:hypothetical protein
MYITAMHVISPTTQNEGLNAYLYVHGKSSWEGPPTPEDDPGSLQRKFVSVEPPGNRVRSYLDIVSPDGTSTAALRGALMQFVASGQHDQLPWHRIVGQMLFRFDVEFGLASQWRSEIVALFQKCEALLTR